MWRVGSESGSGQYQAGSETLQCRTWRPDMSTPAEQIPEYLIAGYPVHPQKKLLVSVVHLHIYLLCSKPYLKCICNLTCEKNGENGTKILDLHGYIYFSFLLFYRGSTRKKSTTRKSIEKNDVIGKILFRKKLEKLLLHSLEYAQSFSNYNASDSSLQCFSV